MARIFAIGSNGSGQLGIGHKEDVSVPKPVIHDFESADLISQVKAGGNHTLLLSSSVIYSSGDSASGACGLRSGDNDASPNFEQIDLALVDPVQSNAPIVLCAASWEASFVVQRDEKGLANRLYSFGIGNKGELGLGELLFRSAKALLIKDFPPLGREIVDLAASVSHVVTVLDNGDVYGWGSGRKGQLGKPDGVVYSPRKIDGLEFKVMRAVCGREFTYLVGEPREGKHIVLGSDKWNVKSVAPPSIPRWQDVGASWGSILVLQDDGKVLSWGRDDHGQLPPLEIPTLSQIAVGSEHALGLTAEGDVLAWGWGEHGNCGPSTAKGDVKGKWNVIASSKYLPPESRIYKIGAGCATSWICING